MRVHSGIRWTLPPNGIAMRRGNESVKTPGRPPDRKDRIVVACLMVSKLPTYSFKNIRIQQRFVLAPMLGVGLLAALSVSAPWLTMTLIVAAYVASIPFSIRSYRRAEAEARKLATGADAPSDSPAANDEAAE